MNETAKYICELLYRYECVILPDFGAFLTKRQPASVQESTHAFFPPQKLISFNRQLNTNDGLLANYIATSENISYTDALAKIQRYVLSLQHKIDKGERIDLEGIGSFFSSIENTLQFEPSDQVNYLTEAFGLNSFISPSIIRETKEEIAIITEDTIVEDAKPAPKLTPAIEHEPVLLPTTSNKFYLKYAATAAAVIGISGLIAYAGVNIINDQTIGKNYALEAEAKKEVDQNLQKATFSIPNPLPAIHLNIIKDTEKPSDAPVNSGEPKVTFGNFHIVAGAYRVADNAIKKANDLQRKGYSARVIGKNKFGLFQVVYGSYFTRTEAREVLINIKKTEDKRAWLLAE